MPGAASVYETTSTTKTYDVQGNIQTTYDGGNCSSAAYSTHFTVALDTAGNPKFTTGSLSLYDDYLIDPSVSPTSIECVAWRRWEVKSPSFRVFLEEIWDAISWIVSGSSLKKGVVS